MSTLSADQPVRSPDSAAHLIPLYRHPLIWLSVILWCVSFLLVVAAAAAAVVTAVRGSTP
jgi:hypothetical protein